MIELELNKGQAIFLMEAVKHHARQITDQIADHLEDEITAFELEQTVAENYVKNLEGEVKRLEEKIASLTAALEFDEKQDSKWKDAMKVFNLKLDGTPKAKPGPKPGSKHATKRIKKEKV